ncbi:MAG: hypothetical protein AB1Z23_07620 [Eubacteriales bacterium]
MKINKKEGILIVLVLFVITFAAYYVYFLTPTLDSINNSKISIEQKNIQIISMQGQIAQIGTLNQQIEELKNEIASKNENIPRGVSEPLQLVEITNILNDNGATLVVVFNNSVEEYENFQKNKVDINFSTDYEHLLYILDSFSALTMANQVVSMDVMYTEDSMDFYSQLKEGYYLNVGFTIEFYSFYEDEDMEVREQQPFEIPLPVDGKNPFVP